MRARRMLRRPEPPNARRPVENPAWRSGRDFSQITPACLFLADARQAHRLSKSARIGVRQVPRDESGGSWESSRHKLSRATLNAPLTRLVTFKTGIYAATSKR